MSALTTALGYPFAYFWRRGGVVPLRSSISIGTSCPRSAISQAYVNNFVFSASPIT